MSVAAIEFSRLAKQVEAYNTAQRDLHNLVNKWDGLTSTERRTRKQVEEVVSVVEGAAILLAQAITDAIPSSRAGGGGGDDEGGDGGAERAPREGAPFVWTALRYARDPGPSGI